MSGGAAKVFSGPAGWVLVIGAGGLVLYLLWNKLTAGLQALGHGAVVGGTSFLNLPGSANSPNNLNAGTPYAGVLGPIGTYGNLSNQASGGTFQGVGETLGSSFYDLINGSYDPNAVTADRNSPPKNASVVTNPVSSSPAILPYSYKQATMDVPWLLHNDEVFTPSIDGGGSGGYAESTGTTTNFE